MQMWAFKWFLKWLYENTQIHFSFMFHWFLQEKIEEEKSANIF